MGDDITCIPHCHFRKHELQNSVRGWIEKHLGVAWVDVVLATHDLKNYYKQRSGLLPWAGEVTTACGTCSFSPHPYLDSVLCEALLGLCAVPKAPYLKVYGVSLGAGLGSDAVVSLVVWVLTCGGMLQLQSSMCVE